MKNIIMLPNLHKKSTDDHVMNISTFKKNDLYNESNDFHNKTDMAEQLYWRPICDNNEPLNKKLKWILKEEDMLCNPLTNKDIGFLQGLRAAGVEDAEKLIDAIKQYGYIELFEH